MKKQSEATDSTTELEQRAVYYTMSQYILEDMISADDPLAFLGTLLIKMKELVGGTPAIGIRRGPGIWDRLILDRATKAAQWEPNDLVKSLIYENIGRCPYVSYSDTLPCVNRCAESVLDVLKSSGIKNITVIPIKHIEGMVLEISNLALPENIPTYVGDIEGFMIPLILLLKQVLLLDTSKKLENESKLLSHILVHDIRNFFTSIEGSYFLLARDGNADVEALEIARTSLDDAKNLIQRVGNALTASVTIKTSTTNLRHVVEECIGVVTSQRNEIELDLKIVESATPENPYVLVDDLLLDIFLNLFNNAIDNTKHLQKCVQIEWNPWVMNSSFLHIQIKDNGSGVPDSILKNLSGRYRIRSEKGLGLGLSIVTRLIQRYNGSFWFERRMENDEIQGSTANIVLPLSE